VGRTFKSCRGHYDFGFGILDFRLYNSELILDFKVSLNFAQSKIGDPKSNMAAIVQWLERLIVVQEVVGSTPTSRPIFFSITYLSSFNSFLIKKFFN
jgi:hypothetical protein